MEVSSPEEVRDAGARLVSAGLSTAPEEGVTCCYALQDKVWANDPDGLPWEHHVVLADAVAEEGASASEGLACDPDSACCPS